MGNFWYKVTHLGVDDNTNDWNQRNMRLMNGMAFILCCAFVMFSVLSMSLAASAELPYIIVSFVLTITYFPIARRASVNFTKLYFCILPIFYICVFSMFGVGDVGNDRYYFLDAFILPLVLFKERKFYMPLALLSVIGFFAAWYVQLQMDPPIVLADDLMIIYKGVNGIMLFIFMMALIAMFKNEIAGYQTNIEEQKTLVEEKNLEITESISYARRIQEAILPVREKFDSNLPENFVYYLPKDIVAGDFYWLEVTDDTVFYAAADCTGHGVPGAMVSVVCHNSLNRSIREFGLKSPAEILNKTRQLVIETFDAENKSVRDGMDIAIVAIPRSQDQPSYSIRYAGAHNPIWIYRNTEGEMEEIKADKQPIGNFEHATDFKEHTIQVSRGDIIYTFSDGYADQFGGEKGKKFKYKPFKEFLIEISGNAMKDQMTLLHDKFENWKGDFEQVDDVCIIGVRV